MFQILNSLWPMLPALSLTTKYKLFALLVYVFDSSIEFVNSMFVNVPFSDVPK